MGIVYHVNYLKWFEAGRIDFLKKAGMSAHELSTSGFLLPLSELQCAFKNPAKYGDEILVLTKLNYMSYVKIKFEYTVVNRLTGKVLATGLTVHTWTNKRIALINIEQAAPEVFNLLKPLVESKQNFQLPPKH